MEKLWEFDSHTAKGIENDRVYYARGHGDWPQDNDAILLGHNGNWYLLFSLSFQDTGVLPQIDEVGFYNLASSPPGERDFGVYRLGKLVP